ncbi:MAG TPA: GNAT family N-acetyltransferase [Burkholderiales bacterium]|nr:GNAT family N-acetyltransferase [Burkholderiales bacterium]
MYVVQVNGPGSDVESVRELFREYAASLGFSLDFQGFEEEIAHLPGEYAPPEGRLLVAVKKGQAVGCAALRRLDAETCEMKRLYVKSLYRRSGIARALAYGLVADARRIGYRRMRLDTLPVMGEARLLYQHMGFREIAPYYQNPLPGTVYMELRLG